MEQQTITPAKPSQVEVLVNERQHRACSLRVPLTF
jgi:hypothetical protein